jgi:predicted metalloprotease with PDZ domain
LVIERVKAGTPAYEGGLYANDELLAIDNNRVSTENRLNFLINLRNMGDTVELLISRDGLIRKIDVQVGRDTDVNYTYELSDDSNREQSRIYKTWLNRTKQNQ